MISLYIYVAAPVLTTPLQTIHTTLGDSISLICTSEGSPPDTFTWMKDGIELQNNIITTSVTYTGTTAVFQSTYSISNFSSSDIGTYTCTVTNPIGSDSLEISLNAISGKQILYLYMHAYSCVCMYIGRQKHNDSIIDTDYVHVDQRS